MGYPAKFKYSKDHEWMNLENSSFAYVGVTDYALEQLGDIVHIDLPEKGAEFDAGAPFGTIESTKTVSDLYMPVSATVVEVNEDLMSHLESLSEDPYEDGWLLKVEVTESGQLKDLMDAGGYEKFIAEQED